MEEREMAIGVAEEQTSDTYDYVQYKALCTSAVAALLVGVLSLLAFLHPWLVALPVVGVLLGIVARRTIRKRSDELTGTSLATIGLILSVIFGVAGPSYQGYVYATEVPDWATRISYAELQPDPDVTGQLIPPSAIALNGKKIFIKGFVYPGKQTDGIQRFVLCRDQGDCCFGGDPKITDRIDVVLANPLRLTYSPRMFKVAGTFRIEPAQDPEGLGAVYYHLDADYLQ
jgi:hypothetical protein